MAETNHTPLAFRYDTFDMGFHLFKFHPGIIAGIKALGFTTPTPIQEKAIPSVLAGRDVLGLAQTGTGKTAAFLLPILERLHYGPRRVLRALILAPTRELAEQIYDVIRSLTPHTGIRSMTIYGGVSMHPQIENLRGGVDLVSDRRHEFPTDVPPVRERERQVRFDLGKPEVQEAVIRSARKSGRDHAAAERPRRPPVESGGRTEPRLVGALP